MSFIITTTLVAMIIYFLIYILSIYIYLCICLYLFIYMNISVCLFQLRDGLEHKIERHLVTGVSSPLYEIHISSPTQPVGNITNNNQTGVGNNNSTDGRLSAGDSGRLLNITTVNNNNNNNNTSNNNNNGNMPPSPHSHIIVPLNITALSTTNNSTSNSTTNNNNNGIDTFATPSNSRIISNVSDK